MRWFKHLTGAHQDEKMARLVSELGLEGYGFYWLILETIAGQIEAGSNRTALTYPVAFWRKITGFSPKKLRNFAEICSKIGIFSAEFSENSLTIDIPNILKYRDEWSRKKVKNSGVAPEPLRTKDTETDTETEGDKPPPTPRWGVETGWGRSILSLPKSLMRQSRLAMSRTSSLSSSSTPTLSGPGSRSTPSCRRGWP
nr:DUF4373 domain-containing protein [Nitratidesulfovibrio sp. HK-II]